MARGRPLNIKQRLKNILEAFESGLLPKHKVAEYLLFHKGDPLSLKGYEAFHPLYDVECKEIIYKTGRQVSKSTTCANIQILNTYCRRNYSILYVAPLEIQVYRYSTLYLKAIMNDSPLIKYKIDNDSNRNVLSKSFTNGAKIQCTYTSTSNGASDRSRGISCDEVDYDEFQDIPEEAVQVIEQCMSGSKYGLSKYFGTPKTMDNVIEKFWQRSSQNTYVSKCRHCGYWNVPVLPDVFLMIKEDGPVCIRCGKPHRPDIGEWVSFNPSAKKKFEGFHIPQIIISANLEKERWSRLYKHFMLYPRNVFANEVLGLSYDSGGRLITLTELERLMAYDPSSRCHPSLAKGRYMSIVAGIDWGVAHTTSFTKFVIMGFRPDGVREILFAKNYTEPDPVAQVQDIAKHMQIWGVDYAAPDQGMGHTNNDLLRKYWDPSRVFPVSYTSMKGYFKWDGMKGMYMADKTATLNAMYIDLKKALILFPKDKYYRENVFEDLLAIIEEESAAVSGGGRKVFKRVSGRSDDFAHCINFATVVGKHLNGIPIVEYEMEEQNYMAPRQY